MAEGPPPAYTHRANVVEMRAIDVSVSGGYLTTAFDQNTLSVRVWSVARPSRCEP